MAVAGISWTGDVDPADPTTWTLDDLGYIGKSAEGMISVDAGSRLLSECGYLGYSTGSVGQITVSGAEATWVNLQKIYVGYEGDGILRITSGGFVRSHYGGYSWLGMYSGSTGQVTVDGDGSSWVSALDIVVGDGGNGTLVITDGGDVYGPGHIGRSWGSVGRVVVDGVGSEWSSAKGLTVGEGGDGELTISGSGTVFNYLPGSIGFASGSKGNVSVDGTGSKWTSRVELSVGYEGDGALSITGGGEVESFNNYVGRIPGSTGHVTVRGVGSTWACGGILTVGDSGEGRVVIAGGGSVSVDSNLIIDGDGSSESFINMSTGGRLALKRNVSGSIDDFLGFVDGTDAIRYWDDALSDWAPITYATYGEDYTLEYRTTGDLAWYTVLTVGVVPEPGAGVLLALAVLGLIHRRGRGVLGEVPASR